MSHSGPRVVDIFVRKDRVGGIDGIVWRTKTGHTQGRVLFRQTIRNKLSRKSEELEKRKRVQIFKSKRKFNVIVIIKRRKDLSVDS